MKERLRFGVDTPQSVRQTKKDQLTPMFVGGEDLPLFSGTPIPAIERPFLPEDHSMKQTMLPAMPPVDYDHVLKKDQALRRRTPAALPPAMDIFTIPAATTSEPEATQAPAAQSEGVGAPPAISKEGHRAAREKPAQLHPLGDAGRNSRRLRCARAAASASPPRASQKPPRYCGYLHVGDGAS